MPTYNGTNNGEVINGSSGNDTINGNGGNDVLLGQDGADVINGGTGNDSIVDYDGQFPDLYADTLNGGDNDDTVYAGYLDSCDGGSGVDTLLLRFDFAPAALWIDFTAFWTGATYVIGGATIQRFENLNWVCGTAFNDIITLGTPAGRLSQASGRDGSDLLTGGAGTDYLNTNFPDGANILYDYDYDELYGLGGTDFLTCGIGDYVDGGSGVDNITFDVGVSGSGVNISFTTLCFTGSDTILGTQFVGIEDVAAVRGSLFNDTLDASAETFGTTLHGRDGDDTLLTGSGDNYLYGGTGADYMSGGSGHDRYYVDNVGDQVVELNVVGNDLIESTITQTLGANVEQLVLSGAGIIDGTGNTLNNNMFGNAQANTLTGLGGDDTLSGSDGADTLIGGVGRDSLTGGNGADSFVFDDGDFSGTAWGTADQIFNFSHAQADIINLTAVDAIAGGGDDAFSFIGTGAFTGVAGQLRYAYTGSDTMIYGDTNGDSIIDFAIKLTGNIALVTSDFGL